MTDFVWLSANEFGFKLLEQVLALQDPEINIRGVITLRPDARTVMYDGVPPDDWNRFGIEVAFIDRIEKDGAEVLRAWAPDHVVMAGWRQIVPAEVLDIPRRGFVSFHPTKLPYGRGPAPLINQILAGVEDSAMSLMYTDDGVDSGDLIGQGPFQIGPDDHAEDVYAKIVAQGVALGIKHLPQLARGNAPRLAQSSDDAVVFPKPSRANWIDLGESLQSTYARIRALSRPYRGAHLEDGLGFRLVVWRARPTLTPRGTLIQPGVGFEAHRDRPQDLYFSDGTEHLQVVEGEIKSK
ncbi:MAG: hypothetical protein KDA24_10200 [Deltaproteobacteria bacterium]|nr:hypothetical protein [Deltaproteobacteria bacterium]